MTLDEVNQCKSLLINLKQTQTPVIGQEDDGEHYYKAFLERRHIIDVPYELGLLISKGLKVSLRLTPWYWECLIS
jgi:hypothetical protein